MGYIRDRARRSTPGAFHMRGGSILFGTAVPADVLLYRSAANVLSLGAGDSLRCTEAVKLGVSGTALTIGATGTAVWAEDANLYRRAAGTLKTDNILAVAGGILTKEETAAVGRVSLNADGKVSVQVTAGSAILLARMGGTTYYFASTGV